MLPQSGKLCVTMYLETMEQEPVIVLPLWLLGKKQLFFLWGPALYTLYKIIIWIIDEWVEYRWARKMEDEGIETNTYIQLIQSLWTESRGLYTILEYSATGATFCPFQLDQLYLCICLNALFFHFASSSLSNSYIHSSIILTQP